MIMSCDDADNPAKVAQPSADASGEAANEALAQSAVRITTTMGVIDVMLFDTEAPKTVDNFLKYVEDGFYDELVFHRVIPKFMIQGGGFKENLIPHETRAAIENEANNGIKNTVDTLAMARTSDPHSATAQFFINLVDNSFLDYVEGGNPGYAVFGKVTAGMDVVQAIAAVKTGNRGPHQNVPVEDVVMKSVRKVE